METNGTILAEDAVPTTLESGAVKWRIVQDWNRYEISDKGDVRVRDGCRNAGLVLTRFWKDGEINRIEGGVDEDTKGSLCVELWDRSKHTTRRVWRLMANYWPGVGYHESWRKKRIVAKPIKPNNEPDKRFKLTEQQTVEIRQSHLSSGELAKVYPVSARHIRAIRQNKKRETNA